MTGFIDHNGDIQDGEIGDGCKNAGDLIPQYTDTTNGGRFFSFTSATHNGCSIRVQEGDHITVSTKTTGDSNGTQFKIYKYISMMSLIIVATLSVY